MAEISDEVSWPPSQSVGSVRHTEAEGAASILSARLAIALQRPGEALDAARLAVAGSSPSPPPPSSAHELMPRYRRSATPDSMRKGCTSSGVLSTMTIMSTSRALSTSRSL